MGVRILLTLGAKQLNVEKDSWYVTDSGHSLVILSEGPLSGVTDLYRKFMYGIIARSYCTSFVMFFCYVYFGWKLYDMHHQ